MSSCSAKTSRCGPQFPKQLRAVRKRKDAFLVVVVDADVAKQDRRDQLNRECRCQGTPEPTDADRVLVAVPRRNIETWFAYLEGDEVDESTSYRKFEQPRECKPLADKLYRMCHKDQKLREPAPPSLREVCRDYPKLSRKH